MAAYTDMHTSKLYIEEYADTGSEAALNRLHDDFAARESIGEGVADAGVLRTCIIRLMETSIACNLASPAFFCFGKLSDDRFLKGAHVRLAEMPTYPDQLYGRLLSRIGTVLSSNSIEGAILQNSLAFINEVGPTLNTHDELRTAMWEFMDKRFVLLDLTLQVVAINAASSFVRPIDGIPYEIMWPSIRDRAFPIMVKALLHIYYDSDRPANVASIDQLVGWNLSTMFQTVTDLRPDQHEGVDESLYKQSRNDLFRLTLLIYNQLNHTQASVWNAETTAWVCVNCAKYLSTYYEMDVLRTFLLYKQPRQAGAKPMVVLMKETAIGSGVAIIEFFVDDFLAPYLREMEGLAEAMSTFAKPAPPARSVKDRHCAFPDCPVDGRGYETPMKKCGRCKTVYYCSGMHQQEHWPEHRKECKAKVK